MLRNALHFWHLTHLVNLPEEEGKDISFFINPKPNNLYSDGQRNILSWEEKNLNEKFEMAVFFEKLATSITNFSLLFILVLVTFLVVPFYLLRKRKKETSRPALLEKERKIVEALQKTKNHELWQKQLQIETGFSKARLSRTLRDLEARGMIKKESLGNTNKICLTTAAERKNTEKEHKEEPKSESM